MSRAESIKRGLEQALEYAQNDVKMKKILNSELPVEDQLLIYLAQRRRSAHRDYLFAKRDAYNKSNFTSINLTIAFHVWIESKYSHISARSLVNDYYKGK